VRPTENLKKIMSRRDAVIVPGAANAMFARVVEATGFEAVYVTGAGIANMLLGAPDIGLTTLSEVADTVARIADTVSIPLIVDADTGFGNAVNMVRTVRSFERAGAAAIQIEDQTFPKRCGHMEGKKVIPRDEMVRKVRAALAARSNPDTVIIARSDAIAVNGLDDAIDRLAAYAEAGADVLFPDAPRTVEEMRAIAAAVGAKPLVANFSEHGKTPLLTAEETAAAGFSICLYPTTSLFAAAQSALEIATALQRDRGSREVLDRLMPFGDLNELLGLSAWQQAEQDAL
jgi:2-methylisocitrate lyase-like PEP mutase family enzyme